MPVKKEKKITKKPVKKPIKKTIKQKQSQRQSVVVNVHTGSSASKRKSSSKASGSSKVERVVPMPNYQASESPYPSYMRQSVAVPVEAGNPAFASVAQTVGSIQNRIPVFADIPKQPSTMTEEEVFIPPPMPEEIPKKKTIRIGKTIKVKLPNQPLENIPISNVGIESESGIANVFTPVQESAGFKPPAGGSFPGIFPRAGSKRLPSIPTRNYPIIRKAPKGSRTDLEQRYFERTGNTWIGDKKDKTDFKRLKQTVEDLEAGVAR